ncbi:hypothetical protein SMQE08_30820 [Serratia marcescens]|nr:hypothetical protein SMQE08_30820 [Serratia marcescens]
MILLFLAFLLLLMSLFSFYMHYKTVSAKRLNIKTREMVRDSVRNRATGNPSSYREFVADAKSLAAYTTQISLFIHLTVH